ncbi:MAG TPA: PilZ domain-containing protein [Roseiarcus sp.]
MTNETLNRAFPEVGRQGDTHGRMFLGVERADWRARPEAALKLGRKLAERGEVAYWVVSPAERSPVDKSADQRTHARERTRLRSAKLLDSAYRFVCEGRICDRSRNGLRLALAQDVPLPPQLAVHIDETSEVREAKVIWRRGATIGIRLHSDAPASALSASQRYVLRERYYAIPG